MFPRRWTLSTTPMFASHVMAIVPVGGAYGGRHGCCGCSSGFLRDHVQGSYRPLRQTLQIVARKRSVCPPPVGIAAGMMYIHIYVHVAKQNRNHLPLAKQTLYIYPSSCARGSRVRHKGNLCDTHHPLSALGNSMHPSQRLEFWKRCATLVPL